MPDAPRLVPATQKIDDNATFPVGHPSASPGVQPPNTYQSGPPQMPGGMPMSIPPQNNYSGPAITPPPSIPPQNSAYQPVKSVPPQAYQPPPSQPPQNSLPYQPVKSTPPGGSIPPQNSRPPTNSLPPTNNGRSVPPQNNPATLPPTNQGFAPTAPAPQPHAPSRPSGSLGDSLAKPPGRRWGLIIFVLLIDLALAGAGVFLLREGLS